MIRVSIIIPVYNVENFICKTLKSCINQTFKDIEIIVVNDGSTDNSELLIRQFADIDKRIVIINKSNEGLFRARHSGIEKAQGEFIFHLDGDDYIAENAIEILYLCALQNKVDIVCSSLCLDKNTIIEYPGFRLKEGLCNSDTYLKTIIDGYSFNIVGKLIKKDLYDDFYYTLLPISIGEDLFQTIQLSMKANRIWSINEYLYYYVQRHSSIMNFSEIHVRAERELLCAMAIESLILNFSFTKDILDRLCFLSLNKICFYLRTEGEYGAYKCWIRKFIKNNYLTSVSTLLFVFNRNVKIFIMIFIQYLSPQLACFFSNIFRPKKRC